LGSVFKDRPKIQKKSSDYKFEVLKMIHVLPVVTSDLKEYPLQELSEEYREEFVAKSFIKKNTSEV
jgi:hypothetical protein